MADTRLAPIPRGDARALSVAVTTPAGGAYNLTGAKIVFALGPKPSAPASFTKANTTGGGSDAQLLVTDAVGGLLEVYIASSDTAPLAERKHYWSLTLQDTANREFTVAQGTVLITPRVTDPIADF